MVAFFGDNPFYTAVDNEHCACSARCHFAVERGAVDADPPLCRLANSILFCMNGTDAVLAYGTVFMLHLFELMPHIIAMRQAPRCADIAGNQQLVIPRNNAAGASAITRCTLCYSHLQDRMEHAFVRPVLF